MNLALRIGVVAFAYVLTFVAATEVVGPLGRVVDADGVSAFMSLFVAGLVHAVVVAVLVRASTARGWRLLLPILLLFWSAEAFLSEVEIALFAPPSVPDDAALVMFAISSLHAVLFVPAAVWLFVRWAPFPPAPSPTPWPSREWLRLPLVAVVYYVLHLVVGYYTFLVEPEVQAHFGVQDADTLGSQVVMLATERPAFLPVQLLRGVAWALVAWPMLLILRGSWLIRGLVLGLAFAGFGNAGHLLPVDWMPDEVRWAYVASTAATNFAMGFVVAGALMLFPTRSTPPDADQ